MIKKEIHDDCNGIFLRTNKTGTHHRCLLVFPVFNKRVRYYVNFIDRRRELSMDKVEEITIFVTTFVKITILSYGFSMTLYNVCWLCRFYVLLRWMYDSSYDFIISDPIVGVVIRFKIPILTTLLLLIAEGKHDKKLGLIPEIRSSCK